jgi:hypothetical protein
VSDNTTMREELEGIKLCHKVMLKTCDHLSPSMAAYIRGRLDTLVNLSADCAEDVKTEAAKMLFEDVG